MKKLILLIIILGVAPIVIGEVSTRVYLADCSTPFQPLDANLPVIEYPDIMVGTKLTIIISSDANDYWVGDLFIAGENRDYGVLTKACYFDAAGEGVFFYPWEDDFYQGFSLETDVRNAVAGDWFVVDYNATHIGDCNVGLYEWFSFVPTYELSFTHVPTRNFNDDNRVDFVDFAMLAWHWQETGCSDPNRCEGTDLDTDNDVDANDLKLFTEYWLKRTEYKVRPRNFNCDTRVDFIDFAVLASYWHVTKCKNPDWCEGTDLDTDNDVDVNDLKLFTEYWLKSSVACESQCIPK